MKAKRLVLCLFLLSTPLLIGGGVYVVQSHTPPPVLEAQPDAQWLELQKRIMFQVRNFPGTAGVVVKDLKRNWVIEHNADTLFPSASLVKIPLMAVLYQVQADGKVSMDEVMALQRKYRTAGSGTLKFKRVGTRLTVRELVFKMITESDNTAANMLTDMLGLDYYNRYFLKLGLTRTNFSRTIMDLRRRDRGVENYTTAHDMAKLLEMIYSRQLIGSDEMLEILKSQKINDRLPVALPKDWQIGHKTGLMRNTCHDVGIVFSPNNDYVICAMTSNIRNYRRAKSFISQIAHLTALYYGSPSLQTSRPEPKKPFWSKIWDKVPSTLG